MLEYLLICININVLTVFQSVIYIGFHYITQDIKLMKPYEIREQKATVVKEMRTILDTAEKEKRDLTAEESEKFDKLKGEVTALEVKEERAEFLAQQEKQQAPDKQFQQVEKRVSLIDAINAQLDGRVNGALAEFNQETERRTGKKAQGIYVPTTNTTTTAEGIVPEDFKASEFIAPLRKSLVMRSLGIRTMTGLHGDVSIPKYKTGMTAGWVGENEALSESGMSFDGVKMTPKHVGALGQVSRQLIQQSSPDINALIRDDLSFVMSEALDKAILTGDGNLEPLGILNQTGIQTGSLAEPSWGALLKLAEALELANVDNIKYLTNPTVMRVLRSIEKEKGTGNYLATSNTIAETPAVKTQQMPAGNLLLGDFSQYILGVWSEVDLLVNPYAESAYNRGNVMIRTLMTVGSVVRHPEAFLRVEDVPV